MVLPVARFRRRRLLGGAVVPPPLLPRAFHAPPEGPTPPVRRVGRGHRPDVRHRPVRGSGARAPRPEPRPPRPRRRQPRGDLRHGRVSPRRGDQDRGVRPLTRGHPSR